MAALGYKIRAPEMENTELKKRREVGVLDLRSIVAV